MNGIYEIFKRSTDAIFGIDRKGQVAFWNPACEELLGHPARLALGQHCSSLLCGTDLLGRDFCSERCPIPKGCNGHAPIRDFDLVVKRADGDALMVNIGAHYVPGSRQQRLNGISVFFALRRVSCQQLIQRLASSSCKAEEEDGFRKHDLSAREHELLHLAAAGLKTGDIARRSCISEATVRNHFKSIYRKLGVHSRAEAVSLAMRKGLV
ncbi:LuxR C-terminal-related transcriptional regulator [Thiohalobacter sp. IOR34]|uniref:helix-turn-helix transcriptional regulator n=1 Tax=Thiohalobacter sp. IOR34 TaxID=3057176 RepID=UPI0025B21269|nr:LuxR C-terminal-related transcriptional regulator [Thiohalobacter sp. IOR34]WJW74912.1 LuxR C-terminal-related transcriptional regulator [Thiohalobacter sp. IOR34]